MGKSSEMNRRYGQIGKRKNMTPVQLRAAAIEALELRAEITTGLKVKECIEYLKVK